MSIWMGMKVFSDLCVLMAILSAFPSVFSAAGSPLTAALLCAFGGAAVAWLQEKGRGGLRWLCVAFPLAGLYLAFLWDGLNLILPGVIYTFLVILWGRLHLEYYSYRATFRQSLMIVGGLYVVLSMLSFLEGVSESDLRMIEAENTLRYGLIHMITGIVLQRQLRLGPDSQGRGSHLQMALVLGGTGTVVLAFVAVEPALRRGAGAVFKGVLSMIMSSVLFVHDLFVSALDQLELKVMYETVAEERVNSGIPAMGPVIQQMMQQHTQGEEQTQSLWWVVLVVTVLLVAMVLLFKAFRKTAQDSAVRESVAILDQTEPKKKESRRSNRGKVRHYYREYLRTERKRGLILKKYDTSLDVLDKATGDTDPDAAAVLRRIYLLARYDDTHEISREQAEQAKLALKKIRTG